MDTKVNKNILVTGGTGFMGRWVSKLLVDAGCNVWIIDNLSNSSEASIEDFREKLGGFVKRDIADKTALSELFRNKFSVCIHLAASINVQESIDNPKKCFSTNVTGTFNILEECRKYKVKMLFISSALVYQAAVRGKAITEGHPLIPSCPYTASKIFGENMTFAYYKTYNLPVVVLRPFSIYGPWQRSDSEGGVMSIFISKKIKNQPLIIYGNGEQGRDFFYIEDCAEFIVKAVFCRDANGKVFNAGSGKETKINNLAKIIAGNNSKIKFVKHLHPHAEVMHMRADSKKARKVLGWVAKTSLREGVEKTTDWLQTQINRSI